MSNVTQAWLEDPTSIRCLLVEITARSVYANTEVTFYLSNMGYITGNADVSYLPYLTGNLQTTESLGIDNNLSMSFGDIQVANFNGELDSWLDSTQYIWVNRTIKVYLGDPRWATASLAVVRNTFEKIFDGVIADVDSSSREFINIKVRDKLQRLNYPLTDSALGTYGTWLGGQTNQDTIKPLIFGEVNNISPILIDPSKLEYIFNDGTSELLIEVRCNGIPFYTDFSVYNTTLNNSVTIPNYVVPTLNTGKFTFTTQPTGTVTCSVQGVKRSVDLTGIGRLVEGSYVNNIANIIALIVTQYGQADQKLAFSDIDLNNFRNFSTLTTIPAGINNSSIGIAVLDRTNTLNVCQEIASSVNAQLFFNRAGLLQLLQLGIPTSDTTMSITDDSILHHTLHISNRTTVVAATKVGYCQNYTPQASVAGTLPSAATSMFAEQWYSNTVVDTAVQSQYKLTIAPIQKDTKLIVGSDCASVATFLNNYFKVPRTVYAFTGTSKLLSLKLGQAVTLTHNRFGLNTGKTGQVITLAPDWANGTVNVEVII